MATPNSFDVLFAGGGLSSALTAYRLAHCRPDLSIGIVESDIRLGGNHTWSFHGADLCANQLDWTAPFVSYNWVAQQVAFPRRMRHLDTGYNSITATNLDAVVRSVANIEIIANSRIDYATATELALSDGQSLKAGIVFDGRGPVSTPDMALGFQKFLGQEIEFSKPHGLTAPIIMDATVAQTDGYRFIYVLPFTETTALIEDTYYADGHSLPQNVLRSEITAYAEAKGWKLKQILREEFGVLPIVLDGDISAFWERLHGGPAPIGLRAGLFHPVTGYSVADTVRLADLIATTNLRPDTTFAAIEAHAKGRWASHQFYRFLNRMLFRAARPHQRYIVLERFYGLPQGLIERFYAGNSTLTDKVRLLAGKPPVPIIAALRALPATRQGEMIKEGLLG